MNIQAAHLAASVHRRLLNQSKARGMDFNLLLARLAIERFLYRLALSPYVDQFVLKGAMMLQVWLPEAGRPTRDLDLLGFGDLSADRLRAYRPKTTIAEKLHAMVTLDLQNSRMKDFFDLLRLAQMHSFTGELLVAAVQDTFARRRTAIPAAPPTAFTPAFAQHPSKVLQWKAFRKKSGLHPVEEDFVSVIEMIVRLSIRLLFWLFRGIMLYLISMCATMRV